MFGKLKKMLGISKQPAILPDALHVDIARASQANERASMQLQALVKSDKASDEMNRVFEKLLGQL